MAAVLYVLRGAAQEELTPLALRAGRAHADT